MLCRDEGESASCTSLARARGVTCGGLDDVFGDVPEFAVGVLTDPTEDVKGLLVVHVQLVHDHAQGHADAPVAVPGDPQLVDFGSQRLNAC
jgi:hypothetical protein